MSLILVIFTPTFILLFNELRLVFIIMIFLEIFNDFSKSFFFSINFRHFHTLVKSKKTISQSAVKEDNDIDFPRLVLCAGQSERLG